MLHVNESRHRPPLLVGLDEAGGVGMLNCDGCVSQRVLPVVFFPLVLAEDENEFFLFVDFWCFFDSTCWNPRTGVL